ncbi:MAG: hypothetical protein ACREE6_09000 [Limisphaerales bacterium]
MSAQTNLETKAADAFGFGGRKKIQILIFEMFVALAMAVAFFFLVKPCFVSGNATNRYTFTSASTRLYRLDQPLMWSLWNERLGGLLLTGGLTDYSLGKGEANAEQGSDRLSDAFAAYHAFWLLLLFVAVIVIFRDALLINLGVFAGLMYDFSPISGPNFYPWDLPVMFFATMTAALFERKRHWLMVAVICVGFLFKETILLGALFVLFVSEWKRSTRVAVFLGIIGLYLIGERLLMRGLELPAVMPKGLSVLSLHGAARALSAVNITDNLRALFAPRLNSVVFANAGTLLAVLALGWRRRNVPYMTVISAYVATMFFLAPPPGISEVRDFMQVLPLSVILLSDWRTGLFQPLEAANPGQSSSARWATRGTASLLGPMIILVIFATVVIIAWRYCVVAKNVSAYNEQLNLARAAMKGGDFAGAIEHEESALARDPSSVEVLNNLAWLRATAPDAALRDGAEAVRLARAACALTRWRQPAPLCTLAAAYARSGRFDKAVATAKAAIALAQELDETNIAEKATQWLRLYEAHEPYRLQRKK